MQKPSNYDDPFEELGQENKAESRKPTKLQLEDKLWASETMGN